MYTYIHTHAPTYLPTYIHTYIHKYVNTYIHTSIHMSIHNQTYSSISDFNICVGDKILDALLNSYNLELKSDHYTPITVYLVIGFLASSTITLFGRKLMLSCYRQDIKRFYFLFLKSVSGVQI